MNFFEFFVWINHFDEVGGPVVVQLHVDGHGNFVYFNVDLKKNQNFEKNVSTFYDTGYENIYFQIGTRSLNYLYELGPNQSFNIHSFRPR